MKAADIKVGEVYAANPYGGGEYDRRAALLVKVIAKHDGSRTDWRGRKQPGWLVELVEGKREREQFVIPSRNIFHDEATELARRKAREARQSEHAERLAEGQELARVIGGAVRSAVGGFTISLTPEEARALSARIREEES